MSEITHSELLTALVIDSALATMTGNAKRNIPVVGVPVPEEERAKLGLTTNNATYFYPVGDDAVFLDVGGSEATVWYNGGDCDSAINVFEGRLKAAHPSTKYLGETANPNNASMLSRAYRVELGDGKVATIDVAFPAASGGNKGKQFAVRVFAQQRKN